MSVIQIREVPAETHDRLASRARSQGMSLSEYLRVELDRIASRPTTAEMLKRVEGRDPVGGASAASILREERLRRS